MMWYYYPVLCYAHTCHNGMARIQVADEGTTSKYGGYLQIYWINSRGQLIMGGPPA